MNMKNRDLVCIFFITGIPYENVQEKNTLGLETAACYFCDFGITSMSAPIYAKHLEDISSFLPVSLDEKLKQV